MRLISRAASRAPTGQRAAGRCAPPLIGRPPRRRRWCPIQIAQALRSRERSNRRRRTSAQRRRWPISCGRRTSNWRRRESTSVRSSATWRRSGTSFTSSGRSGASSCRRRWPRHVCRTAMPPPLSPSLDSSSIPSSSHLALRRVRHPSGRLRRHAVAPPLPRPRVPPTARSRSPHPPDDRPRRQPHRQRCARPRRSPATASLRREHADGGAVTGAVIRGALEATGEGAAAGERATADGPPRSRPRHKGGCRGRLAHGAECHQSQWECGGGCGECGLGRPAASQGHAPSAKWLGLRATTDGSTRSRRPPPQDVV